MLEVLEKTVYTCMRHANALVLTPCKHNAIPQGAIFQSQCYEKLRSNIYRFVVKCKRFEPALPETKRYGEVQGVERWIVCTLLSVNVFVTLATQ
jgi:hypothetical protein